MLLAAAGCGTDDPNDPFAGFPREATIEYKVTSTQANAIADVEYTNATGGDTDLDDQILPFSVKITKTVEFAEIFTLLASTDASSVTLQILVDGQIVENETSETNSSSQIAVISYQFGSQ